MAIYEDHGLREVVRNARLEELLEWEPERDRLHELIARQARLAAESRGLREQHRELVLTDCLSPELPTTQELRISFGLRGREPEVALLAAEGLSNAAIAGRLRLSAHTVRYYLERVLDRLGLHSRKALALHLMGGGGERPQPPDPSPGKIPRVRSG